MKRIFYVLIILFLFCVNSCHESGEEEESYIEKKKKEMGSGGYPGSSSPAGGYEPGGSANTDKAVVTKLEFSRKTLELLEGQETYVSLSVFPQEAGNAEKAAYSLSAEEVCVIRSGNNSGIYIKGLKKGTVILTAETSRARAFLGILVE